MNAERKSGKHVPLNDEELSRLMDPEINQEEREQLLERLNNDPRAAEVLALASTKSSGEGLPERVVEKVLATVRERTGDTGICPYCAGDLVPDAPYCPHCSAQVVGNPFLCIQCGSPVREGSVYCAKCGSFFRSTDGARSGPIESQWFLLVLGVISIIVAVLFRSMTAVFLIFLAIGLISLGALWGEVWLRWRRAKHAISIRDAGETETEEDSTRRKSG